MAGVAATLEDVRRALGIVAFAGAGMAGCAQDEGAAFDTNALIDSLRASGATVDRRGSVSQPFFSVTGTALSVNGETVQAFEYRDERRAAAESRTVSADGGTIGTTAVSWVGPPHFHRRERVIALYVGDTAAIQNALSVVMGPQFAGR